MAMLPIPEELLEQVERGNALLSIGERIVRDAHGNVAIDVVSVIIVRRGLLWLPRPGIDQEPAVGTGISVSHLTKEAHED